VGTLRKLALQIPPIVATCPVALSTSAHAVHPGGVGAKNAETESVRCLAEAVFTGLTAVPWAVVVLVALGALLLGYAIARVRSADSNRTVRF
jgi:disulfide bond formation protein DsbB